MSEATRALLLGTGAVALANAATGSYLMTFEPEAALKLWTVYSARLSFLLFLVSYGIEDLHRLCAINLTAALRRRRRQVGLSFAAAHTVHLAVLAVHLLDEQFWPGWPLIVFGGFGYVLMWAMAATSNDAAVARLGPRWKRLHRVGAGTLAAIFFYIYALRVAMGEYVLFSLPAVVVLLGLVALRLSRKKLKGAK